MGFFDSIKKDWEKGVEISEQRRLEKAIEKSKTGTSKKYRPTKNHGSAVSAGVYDTFGVDSFDAIFEETAPHLVEAIYDTRDNLAGNNKYYELLGRYNELEKRYNELQKNYQDLVSSLSKGK